MSDTNLIDYEYYYYDIKRSAIIFKYEFNLALDKHLNSIKQYNKIIFNINFNYPIDNLHYDITHLELGYEFTHSVKIFSKFNLMTHLKISYYRNKIDIFPTFLKWLNIKKYNYELDNLPSGLLYLITKSFFKYDNLPCGLLYLKTNFILSHISNLPSSIKYLDIYDKYNTSMDNLPNSLYYLTISVQKFDIINLPKNIYHLTILLTLINVPNILLPSCLSQLVIASFWHDYNTINLNKLILPSKLKYLECLCSNIPINIPNSVEHLVIGHHDFFTYLKLPKELKILKIILNKTDSEISKIEQNELYQKFLTGKTIILRSLSNDTYIFNNIGNILSLKSYPLL